MNEFVCAGKAADKNSTSLPGEIFQQNRNKGELYKANKRLK